MTRARAGGPIEDAGDRLTARPRRGPGIRATSSALANRYAYEVPPMYNTPRSRAIGALYLAPVTIFVLIFTAFPLSQMIWMSFHNWSLIEPKRWVGAANFVKDYNDRQFWISL